MFAKPEFLFLFPAFLVLGFFWKQLKLFQPLRLLLLAGFTLLLADPRLNRQQKSLDLWVLCDRSESTDDLVDKALPEWRKLLNESKPSRKDKLHFVDYAAEVITEEQNDQALYTGSRKATRTGLAIQNALALAEKDKPARVLLFSDGFATESLATASAQLQAQGIPLDFRLVRDETSDDYSLTRLQLPDRARTGEPFIITVTVRGSEDKAVPLRIFRGKSILTETSVNLVNGVAQIEFTDRLSRTGSYEYRAEILPQAAEPPLPDAYPGNNLAERLIQITGGPRILLVTKYNPDPLEEILANQNYTLEVVRKPQSLNPGQLSGARAVIINNIPSYEINADFLAAIPFYVEEQGGGLMMAGGKFSFGSGGYYESAIDDLLPVSMELKSEHRKLSVAMAIVMDRSGSMSMSAGGKRTKMDLANNGAAEAIDLLGVMDEITILAVDSEAHEIVPLTQIENKKKSLTRKARSVQSMGGGIYVYNGLKAAWDRLKLSQNGTKHVILFSDAADSEEPGAYKILLKEMTDAGATVSVIGLGNRSDPDAQLLEDIATEGKGRIFFTERPMDIPKLFAQETVMIARSAFIEDPAPTMNTGRGAELFQREISWLPQVDGYNLSYPRPDATVSLAAKDEYLAPLVAHRRVGAGRSLAISFPLGGEFSQSARSWPEYGNVMQSITQWLAGDTLPPGLGLQQRLDGTTLSLDFFYDLEEWGPRFAQSPPQIKLLHDSPGAQPYEITWERLKPGNFSLRHELEEGTTVRGSLRAGPYAVPFGPLAVGSSIEWNFDPDRLAELKTTSQASGGRELLDLSQAWLRPPSRGEISLRFPILITILILMLADALVTRIGWTLPEFAWAQRARKPSGLPKRTRIKKNPDETLEPVPPSSSNPDSSLETPPSPKPAIKRGSRFDRAKRRR